MFLRVHTAQHVAQYLRVEHFLFSEAGHIKIERCVVDTLRSRRDEMNTGAVPVFLAAFDMFYFRRQIGQLKKRNRR